MKEERSNFHENILGDAGGSRNRIGRQFSNHSGFGQSWRLSFHSQMMRHRVDACTEISPRAKHSSSPKITMDKCKLFRSLMQQRLTNFVISLDHVEDDVFGAG
ncbi:hypothetical protein Tco_1427599 [Tanacetum coccineum]